MLHLMHIQVQDREMSTMMIARCLLALGICCCLAVEEQ